MWKNIGNWISVDDRLPEADPTWRGTVLVVQQVTLRSKTIALIRQGWRNEGNWYEIHKVGVLKGVVFWQPLPEPPEWVNDAR